MKLIEFLFDTRHKRSCALCLLYCVLILKECIANAFFVFPVMTYKQIESLYNLTSVANTSFIGRLLYNIYLGAQFDLLGIIKQILLCFDFWLVLSLLLTLYFVFTKYTDHIFKVIRLFASIVFIVTCVIYTGGLWYIVKNLTIYTSYETVLKAINMIAIWLFSTHTALAIITLLFIFMVVRDYLRALEYKCVELNEFEE